MTFRFPTSWGDGWLRLEGSSVVELHPPGSAVPGVAHSIETAPEQVRELGDQLARYFDGDDVEFVDRDTLRRWLDDAGVAGFRRDALLALFDVPFGMTVTYGELAELGGRSRAVRAVGSACANNPLPIIVPCHRVLPASRKVGNYGSLGSDYKLRLLELERLAIAR